MYVGVVGCECELVWDEWLCVCELVWDEWLCVCE